ncbi:hypothetical protein ECANGB1_1872 [Enterospora canceri]|uniref:Uncharacterized protein n=1 Tax=Enterospora canceri TaxID=1081671 RepID=A0A1Y1S5C2_9MICR|nr:hypothetical protein ECANGB1_1872 [Enterospora canceri]
MLFMILYKTLVNCAIPEQEGESNTVQNKIIESNDLNTTETMRKTIEKTKRKITLHEQHIDAFDHRIRTNRQEMILSKKIMQSTHEIITKIHEFESNMKKVIQNEQNNIFTISSGIDRLIYEESGEFLKMLPEFNFFSRRKNASEISNDFYAIKTTILNNQNQICVSLRKNIDSYAFQIGKCAIKSSRTKYKVERMNCRLKKASNMKHGPCSYCPNPNNTQ